MSGQCGWQRGWQWHQWHLGGCLFGCCGGLGCGGLHATKLANVKPVQRPGRPLNCLYVIVAVVPCGGHQADTLWAHHEQHHQSLCNTSMSVIKGHIYIYTCIIHCNDAMIASIHIHMYIYIYRYMHYTMYFGTQMLHICTYIAPLYIHPPNYLNGADRNGGN